MGTATPLVRFMLIRHGVLSEPAEPAAQLDQWLANPGVRCCDLQGGFVIDSADGAWAEDSLLDEFWMTASWIHALDAISNLEPRGVCHPWEEGEVILEREGSSLRIRDAHVTAQGPVDNRPPITFEAGEFLRAMIRELKKFSALGDGVRREIARRKADGDSRADLDAIVELLPPESMEGSIGRLEERLDRIEREGLW